jgi:hypothetical protein
MLDGKLRKFALWFRQAKGSGKRYFFAKEDNHVKPESDEQYLKNETDENGRFANMPPNREEPPPWE